MLEYDRIDISEGIDLNKTNKSKECMLCHYWYFLKTFIMDHIFVVAAIMTQKSIDPKNIDSVYTKGNAYRIHFLYMSKHKHKHKRKHKAISLMTNSNLIDKKGITIFSSELIND